MKDGVAISKDTALCCAKRIYEYLARKHLSFSDVKIVLDETYNLIQSIQGNVIIPTIVFDELNKD